MDIKPGVYLNDDTLGVMPISSETDFKNVRGVTVVMRSTVGSQEYKDSQRDENHRLTDILNKLDDDGETH